MRLRMTPEQERRFDEAYEEGKAAALQNVGEKANPYRAATVAHSGWLRGWNEGMKNRPADSGTIGK